MIELTTELTFNNQNKTQAGKMVNVIVVLIVRSPMNTSLMEIYKLMSPIPEWPEAIELLSATHS